MKTIIGNTRPTTARMAVLILAAATAWSCVDKRPNPSNELPGGFVDTPAANAVLKPGPTFLAGWAVDDSAISAVRVFFDGHFVAQTVLTVHRPDVAAALPQFARKGDLLGWNLVADFAPTPGPHTILVQAVDDAGATKDIGLVPVTAPR